MGGSIAASSKEFKKEELSVNKLSSSLEKVNAVVENSADSIDDLSSELKKTGSNSKKAGDAVDDLGDDLGDVGNKSKKATGGLSGYSKQAGLAAKKTRSLTFGIKSMALAFASFLGVRQIFNINTEFQRLDAQLVVITGNQNAAAAAFDKWKLFARETPAQIKDIVGSFTKLRNFGLKATEKDLLSYSNTAAATGKKLNQFIEAVADAAVLEFERLKEFGILARQESDSIRFTFRGVTTQIEKDSDAIQGYLASIGSTHFAGSIEEQMKTLGGASSNLNDAFSEFLDTVGRVTGFDKATSAVFEGWAIGLRKISDAIDETDVERQQHLFDKMLELELELREGGHSSIRVSALKKRIEKMRTELVELTDVLNEGIVLEGDAHEAQLAQDRKAAELRAKEKSDRLRETLSHEFVSVQEAALSLEELENISHKKRLDLLVAAEQAGVESILPFNELRARLISNHLDNIKSIALNKQLELDQAANEQRERADQVNRDRRFLEIADAEGRFEGEFTAASAQHARLEIEEQKHQDKLRSIRMKHAGEYGGIVNQFVDFDRSSGADRVSIALSVGEKLSGAAAKESKKAFEINKKLRIAQAVMSAFTAINNAYAELPYPINIAASVAIGALAFANIKQINSQKFQGGRQFGGNVSANSFVEVGEQNRPELFEQDGKLLLFPGNRGGKVTPFDASKTAAGNPTSQGNANNVIVNIHNAPEGVQVEKNDNNIDIHWPDIQSRLADDINKGADWVDNGQAALGWNRSNSARARR